jgi:hypothetical protein
MTWEEMKAAAVANIACPYCGAPTGQNCASRSGKPVSFGTHTRRVRPIQQAWWSGYSEARDRALDDAIDHPEHWAFLVEKRRQYRATETASAAVSR